MRRRRPRVFIGLTEVAGVYTSLQQGLDELGIQTMRVDVAGNPRGYRAAVALPTTGTRRSAGDRWAELGSRIEEACAVVKHRRTRSRGSARLIFLAAQVTVEAVRSAYRLALLTRVIAGYDVVVLTGGASFFRGRDLALLHRLGKRIVVVFTGSDHRPPFLNGKMYRAMSTESMLAESRRIRHFLRLAERYATAIIALSSSAQFHSRPFIHLLALGIPFSPREDDPAGRERVFTGSGVRVLHCPTDPISKGTDEVRTIIEELRAGGLAIDYVEIMDRPHVEVLAGLQECDFVIDELHSDTPLGRLATEAAWFGKSAVTAGEYAREIEDDLPPALIPPSAFVTPEEIRAEVRRFATDADYRTRKGDEVGVFVRIQWAPKAVAMRFLRIVDGAVPGEWIYDPASLSYVGGWGLGADEWRLSVGAVIDKAGVEYLGVSQAVAGRLLARLREAPSAPDGGSEP